MTWKDLMLILNQTLTSNEVRTALEAAKNFRDELFLSYQDSHRGASEEDIYSTGCEAVPWEDPEWDPNNPLVTWQHKHFQMYFLDRLRRTRVKPLNYSKLGCSGGGGASLGFPRMVKGSPG